MTDISIIDYGIGNLFSVKGALERVGGMVTLTSAAEDIEKAGALILPGVGAFENGMRGLRERGLIEPIKRYAASGRPLLGICLGMQMLASASEEFGEHEGLDLIKGRVVAVPRTDREGRRLKIPHIGWSALRPSDDASWSGTLLDDTEPGTFAYLVHSFYLVPDHAANSLAWCNYGGHMLTAAVRSGNIFGAQYHPEKSGEAGLRMLAAFLRMSSCHPS